MSLVQNKTRNLTRMALIIAIEVILAFTNLGFIMVPPVSITIMHIPVIVGSILMGPVYGGVFGACFGIISLIKASMAGASPVDMLFSPMLSGAPIQSIIMCIVPRIILGILPALLYNALRKHCKSDVLSIGIGAGVATIMHTLLVMLCLWAFFSAIAFREVFATLITVNGILELIAGIVIAIGVCKPLLRLFGKK